ncbi:Hypothetical predicted protein [Paramuricea clavata]|uniref:Uncharacterized protein n=1 Tax=Paramuricea clavata TaxID=317549 RepID=A0A6S7J0V8_PARCT|nr:Hypothetical predicted protein [Paramuricea clavata]
MAVPYIQSIPSEHIRIAYKDVTLSSGAGQNEGVFINILPGNPMVLGEAFRNVYDCGAESFKRIEIKLCETKQDWKINRYNTTTTSGKILLQKDLATLRIVCNNKIPIPSMDEREYFTELLGNQQKQVTASDLNFDARAASTSQININSHISSPVSKKAKRHKTKTVAMPVEISSSDDHSTDSSDTSSDDSESFDEGKRSKSQRTKNITVNIKDMTIGARKSVVIGCKK